MLKLVIGDKNISSWSLRPWILLRHLEIDFEEINLLLYTEEFAAEIHQYTPAGKVPVLLLEGDVNIWDSLAICEYASELAQGRGWPTDPMARAQARSISAEMHSGFRAMRADWPMNATARLDVPLTPQAEIEVMRIDTMWQDCRDRHAGNGPWLFGRYSAADAMYAPVVLRFNTYHPALSPGSQSYLETALADPHLQSWIADAAREVEARKG